MWLLIRNSLESNPNTSVLLSLSSFDRAVSIASFSILVNLKILLAFRPFHGILVLGLSISATVFSPI